MGGTNEDSFSVATVRQFAGATVVASIVLLAPAAYGQTPVAFDDVYGVKYNNDLVVESPGVLANDTFEGSPAEDAGATAVLVDDAIYGFLSLAADGSFTYAPYSDFPGTDTFTYEAVVGGQTSLATVTLTACSGGPTVFTCWAEASYLAKLGELNYSTFQEGFESDAAWGSVREPDTAPTIISQGIAWQSNHPDPPASNEIMTGDGPARTGLWGFYDPDHGYATGTPTECDVDDPPVTCLFKDGFTGTRQSGESTLYGVGGYITGQSQPNVAFIIDGGTPIGFGALFAGGEQFFGVIDTSGFTSFRVEETASKIGQERYVYGDDFTFAVSTADTTPPQVSLINSFSDTGDGILAEGEVTAAAINELLVTFDELVSDEGDETAPHNVINPANYLLFSDGGDGFDTVDCSTGVDTGDTAVAIDWITYVSGSERTATLEINGGTDLARGGYRLLVCGTTSIKDWAGNSLDGDGNGTGGDDFARNFTVTGPPGSMQFSLSAYTVAENGTSATITVTRTGGDFGAASVNYATSDGSATEGSDYNAASGTINFADGDAVSKPFTVPISDDSTWEGDETVNLALTSAVGATLGTPNLAVLTITEDDPGTWFVAPTGSDAADCISLVTPCLTISEAVSRAASGDSIQVATGLYSETLSLSKSLTVIGTGLNPVIDGSGSGVVVSVLAGATATMSNFEIRNGTTGGVENAGNLTLVECWIYSNGDGSTATFGGVSTSGVGRIERSTVSGNFGDTSGGIANSGQLDVVNSTVQGNAAAFAQGIYNPTGATLDLLYSTVAENGAYGIRGGGTVRAEASIIALHGTANCETAITTLGYNLEDGFTCGLSAPANDLIGVNPMLGVLAAAGGPTPTMALLSGSPAIDTGGSAACLATDQRGVGRPIDGDENGTPTCDIGAFEFQSVPIFTDDFESGDTSAWSAVVP